MEYIMTKQQREELKTIGGLVCEARARLEDLLSDIDYESEDQEFNLENASDNLQSVESELDNINGV